ncbi:MAG: beta-glucosidase [Povalibacter sp.]
MNDSFQSFMLGGFECSAHRRADGVRLDLLASSKHDALVEDDYAVLAEHGINAVRDGVRWHLAERSVNFYDWSSVLPTIRAAQANDTQVVWDLCHYGWPDGLDIWSTDFITRFAKFARAFATLIRDQFEGAPVYCPLNEMSYWAWAGGEVGRINPAERGRGRELKKQLVRAYIAALEAIRSVDPRARFSVVEPLIHVAAGSDHKSDLDSAEDYRRSQFEVHDMITGAQFPELGGRPDCLDLVGLNFYPDNQWYLHGTTIPLGHHAYLALRQLLREVANRYDRPLWIAETGAEGLAKPYWLHYVCGEVREALSEGIDVQGVCLYPITDYHGWDNGRECSVGLLSLPDSHGKRRVCPALQAELEYQVALFSRPARFNDNLREARHA